MSHTEPYPLQTPENHLSVRYRLSCVRSAATGICQYQIRVAFGTERAIAPLGTDFETAKRIYDQIVRGAVTPCTLADVLADFCVSV